MTRRKQRTKEEIEKELLNFVENLEFPTTSTEIARVIGLNYFTAKKYLDKLKKEGKLHLKKVGRQHQWWMENMSKQKKLAEKSVGLEKRILEVEKKNLELKEENKELKKWILELES